MTEPRVDRRTSSSDCSLLLAHCAALTEIATTRVAEAESLRLEEWRVLDHLARCDGATMSELAVAALVTSPTLTRTVDHLVSVGLVYRAPAPDDRRKIVVRLAQKGQTVHASMAETVSAAEEQVIVGALGERDAEELRRLLTQLLAQGQGQPLT